MTGIIYRDDREVSRRPENWESAGSPFPVRWVPANASEGWYRLVLSGYFQDNTPVDKEIVFYHRPMLPDLTAGGQRR